jgi:hypothetical protein
VPLLVVVLLSRKKIIGIVLDKRKELLNPATVPTEKWMQDLYFNTKKKWQAEGGNEMGFAIFYSPIKVNPKIMIIGLNPGGGVESVDEPMKGPLSKHDYFVQNYPIARNMKRIFTHSELKSKLKNSVKLNLYFFRSRDWKSLQIPSHLKIYCEERVKEIVSRLQPKVIVAEGFQTYKALKTFSALNIPDKEVFYPGTQRGRRIILIGQTLNIPLIGITHPSASRGISNDMLDKIGNHLKTILDSEL